MQPKNVFRATGLAAVMIVAMSAVAIPPANATESGTSLYLLGSKGQGAGILPPEGVYFSNPFFFYSGDANASFTFGGVQVDGAVDVDAFSYFPTGLWVTPVDIFGGDLAVGLTVPVGAMDVNATGTITFPMGGVINGTREDSFGGFGDPVLNAVLGWHQGNSHWTVGTMMSMPIGDYEPGELANLSFNRWIFDVTAAYTWLDPAAGLDLSVAAGVTFNGTNDATDYNSGHELHFEASAAKYLSPTFSVGVNFFHMQQITADSGAGAVLGDFKGRVTAIGPEVKAVLPIAGVPVFASAKWMEELETEHRVKGRGAWVTLTVPLGPGGQ